MTDSAVATAATTATVPDPMIRGASKSDVATLLTRAIVPIAQHC